MIPKTLQGAHLSKTLMEMAANYNHIGNLGLFKNEFTDTPFIAMPTAYKSLSYIPCTEPCKDGVYTNNEVETDIADPTVLKACHRMTPIEVLACQINGFVKWDTGAWETVRSKIQDELVSVRENIDYSTEVDMLNAILGKYAILGGHYRPISDKFGAAFVNQTDNVDMSTVNLDTFMSQARQRINAEGKKYKARATQFVVLCGDVAYNKLLANPQFDITQNRGICCDTTKTIIDAFGESRKMGSFSFVNFEGYGLASIPDNAVIVVPLNVRGLFVRYFTPANLVGSLGKRAKPITIRSRMIDVDRGIRTEVHTDPLILNRLPQMVVHYTQV